MNEGTLVVKISAPPRTRSMIYKSEEQDGGGCTWFLRYESGTSYKVQTKNISIHFKTLVAR